MTATPLVRATRIAFLLVAALGLTACVSVPLPGPTETPTLNGEGAVHEDLAETIVAEVFSELAAADAASDATLLTDRVAGAAKRVRAAEYIIAANGGDAPDVLPSGLLATYVSRSDTWPRALALVTEPADAGHTPVVILLVQDNPRSPYQVRAWAHMLPGATLPAMAPGVDGAEPLALDALGLTSTPREAIENYASLLSEGATSEFESAFAPDDFRSRMFSSRTALAAAAKARGGTYTDTVEARKDQTFVFQTAEGGALVFLPVNITSDFNVPGAQLLLPKADKALLGSTLKSRAVHHYDDLLVLRISAVGSGVLPALVAADHHLVAVTAVP